MSAALLAVITTVCQQAESAEITLTAGEKVITARLDESEITKAFLATLPRTFAMRRYGDREYYGRMDEITKNGEEIGDFENGDVTYYPGGPSFAVFFVGAGRSSQSSLIRMGKITSGLSLFENLGESVEMLVRLARQPLD